jgi:hypothetical protein
MYWGADRPVLIMKHAVSMRRWLSHDHALVLCVFDLIELDSQDFAPAAD